MPKKKPARGRCPFSGCTRRRAVRPSKLVGHRYNPVPLKWCTWHLDPEHREMPEERRARILNGGGP